jgi:membrane protein implicated in regulation of membrane protease activity
MTSKILKFLDGYVQLSGFALLCSGMSIALGLIALKLGEPLGALSVNMGAQSVLAEAVTMIAAHALRRFLRRREEMRARF